MKMKRPSPSSSSTSLSSSSSSNSSFKLRIKLGVFSLTFSILFCRFLYLHFTNDIETNIKSIKNTSHSTQDILYSFSKRIDFNSDRQKDQTKTITTTIEKQDELDSKQSIIDESDVVQFESSSKKLKLKHQQQKTFSNFASEIESENDETSSSLDIDEFSDVDFKQPYNSKQSKKILFSNKHKQFLLQKEMNNNGNFKNGAKKDLTITTTTKVIIEDKNTSLTQFFPDLETHKNNNNNNNGNKETEGTNFDDGDDEGNIQKPPNILPLNGK